MATNTTTITRSLTVLAGLLLAAPVMAEREPDGSIPRADWKFPATDATVTISGTIGNGDFGGGSGDFDWYKIPARAGDVIDIQLASSNFEIDYALYDKQGNLLGRVFIFPTGIIGPFEFDVPVGDAYYLVVTNQQTGLQNDPFDPGSGSGSGATGDYEIDVTVESTADSQQDLVQETAGLLPPAAVLGDARSAVTFDGLIPPDGSMTPPGNPMTVELEAGEVLVADMWGVRNGSLDNARLLLRDSSGTQVAEADDSDGLWGSFDPSDPKTQDPFLLHEAADGGEFQLDPEGSAPAGGPSGLFQLATAVFEPGVTIDGGFSGAWFNPADNGQGFDVEIVETGGGQLTLAVAWFTTDIQGNAFWVQGAAPIDPSLGYVVVPVRAARTGSPFGPFFDPAELTDQPWGYLVFTFQDCDNGTVYYGSNFGFGAAEYPIQRITTIAQTECEVETEDD